MKIKVFPAFPNTFLYNIPWYSQILQFCSNTAKNCVPKHPLRDAWYTSMLECTGCVCCLGVRPLLYWALAHLTPLLIYLSQHWLVLGSPTYGNQSICFLFSPPLLLFPSHRSSPPSGVASHRPLLAMDDTPDHRQRPSLPCPSSLPLLPSPTHRFGTSRVRWRSSYAHPCRPNTIGHRCSPSPFQPGHHHRPPSRPRGHLNHYVCTPTAQGTHVYGRDPHRHRDDIL